LTNLDGQKAGPLFVRNEKQKSNTAFSERLIVKQPTLKPRASFARISRQTFYDWQRNDEFFAALLLDADKDADDTLEQALYDRAVLGIPSYVVSHGHIMYEEIPVLDEETKQPKRDDKGHIILKKIKPLIERKYSDFITSGKAQGPQA
jgi:hypothetical protein